MRRNRLTPFEIMGQVARSAGDSPSAEPVHKPAPRERAASSAGDGGGGRFSGASHWWASLGAGAPVVLRVPRGLAVVLVVALVGLLLLAYWVGHSRGVSAGQAMVARQAVGQDDEPAVRRAPSRPAAETSSDAVENRDASADATRSGAGAGVAGTPALGTAVDPREPGRNYFVLASYPPQAAETLAEWLREEHGVATVLEPVQNGRLREVIAVDRGFDRDELYGPAYDDYERELRSVGRAWRQHNDGRGDALDTMYPKRYDGP